MAKKVLIFGNSGSGKSTLAQRLSQDEKLVHLDLDTLAWLPNDPESGPPQRRSLADSAEALKRFVNDNHGWVVEGCYADLLSLLAKEASDMIFLNLPVEDCIANARQRPWEPHKYPSKDAQDANLEMLIDWIAHYETRSDTFSLAAHQALYDAFSGCKQMFISRPADH